MNTMKYRAVLIDEKANQERPVQIFGSDRGGIDKWATTVLTAALSDDACVNVYATEEHHVAMIVKPKKPAAAQVAEVLPAPPK